MAKAGQRTPAKISGERSKPRAKRRKRAAQAILRTTSQRFALTVRARDASTLPLVAAQAWNPRRGNGTLPGRSTHRVLRYKPSLAGRIPTVYAVLARCFY